MKVSDKDLQKAAQEGIDQFLNVFVQAYLKEIGDNLSAENMSKFNGHQHSLLALYYFCEEVRHGGFVQLIQNGYGSYIFDNPFAKSLRIFGAEDLSKLIYKAKKIYDANKKELEKETTEEEFMAMYEQFEVFDELEEQFMEIEEEQIGKVANYVDENIKMFIEIA
jgi:hypothetical protein